MWAWWIGFCAALSVLLSFLPNLDCHGEEAGFDDQLSLLIAPEFLLNFSSWDFTKISVVRGRSELPSAEVSRPAQRAVSQQDSFRVDSIHFSQTAETTCVCEVNFFEYFWHYNCFTCKTPHVRHGACLKLQFFHPIPHLLLLMVFPNTLAQRFFWFICVGF